ncbi:hypothetical protein GCM10010405_03900 [Streptomyces macrosporus]|uniref:Uncharacterized protein n=1 Tax=Streptomyces macrosporus TaxID=44032 RepID=A0ABP5WDV7_9ACTN
MNVWRGAGSSAEAIGGVTPQSVSVRSLSGQAHGRYEDAGTGPPGASYGASATSEAMRKAGMAALRAGPGGVNGRDRDRALHGVGTTARYAGLIWTVQSVVLRGEPPRTGHLCTAPPGVPYGAPVVTVAVTGR